MVYKFIAEGTIEEKIQELQEEKKHLLGQIIDIDSIQNNKIEINFLSLKDAMLKVAENYNKLKIRVEL